MTDTIRNCLILIPALPLAAAVLVALLGAKVLRGQSHWPVVLALLGSFVCSLILLREVNQRQDSATPGGFEQVVTLWKWADIANAYYLKVNPPAVQPEEAGWRNLRIEVALRADALTAIMLAMVTFVSALVAVYAAGYMAGDRGYWRFFAYIGLFVFSMTMLVSVSNFVLLFVFWEAVGVCSYLLIGFWYQKPEAAAAGVKAFLVNRVGDFAFTIALFLIWCTYGTLNYHDSLADGTTDPAAIAAANTPDAARQEPRPPAMIRGVLGQTRIAASGYVTGALATAICLLLLLGACGKSAQFPLHVWLPDAMEGPTPVSALIHAATMVTAGVYMVARCTPLFAVAPAAQLVVATIGGFTALLAGLIALTQFDLKRVLAYSTISQLGYMFLALGAGTFAGVTGGMYHLFTHAFFKALLFLGAGSVMHAMGGVIDMRQFSGLRRLMPWTYVTFFFGCVALAGVPPFAGFWSKDAVLAAVHDKVHAIEHELDHRHQPPHGEAAAARPLHNWSEAELTRSRLVYQWLYYGAVATAFLTAFYTFRAFALTFHGPLQIPAQAGHHAHESPPVMVTPLAVLAVCSILVGMYCIADRRNFGTNILVDFLSHTPSLAAGAISLTKVEPAFHVQVAAVSTIAAIAGIGLALFFYLGERSEARFLSRLFDLQGADRWTDPQWVTQLERMPWIAAVTRLFRQARLGWMVTLLGYALGTLSIVLSVPLVVGRFLSPYRLSRDKFYFDELYAALVVWPLSVLAAVLAWVDRWIVDGLVNLAGRVPVAIGSLMRPMQMGLVQFYALAMVLGMLMLILVTARLLWASG
ncbi:MAG TPA: NADH-quinone oxidoreductase subunit L [Pirellulaceae bacterium]|nr:NADH-quinone oxidoreductase subunit L [Pirellulaceae bacterium]